MPSSIKPTSRKMRQHDPFCGDIPAKEESNIVRYNCISVSKRFVMKIINAYPIKIIFL